MSSSELPFNLTVKCDIHGVMKFKPKTKKDNREGWICHGYDGEGCCNVTIEQAYRLGYGKGLDPKDPLLPARYTKWINRGSELVVNVRQENLR